MRRTLAILIPLTLAAQAAAAQSVGRAALGQPEMERLHLSYAAYAAGLNVVNVDATLDMSDRSYRIELDYRTAGLFGAIVNGNMQSIVAGLWEPNGVLPVRFYAYGQFRGSPRRTLIDYADGEPSIKILEPPPEAERDPVPPAMRHHTIDSLSAIALLMHEVALTGRCEGHVTTFDGRRVSEITVHGVGQERLSAASGSIFSGDAQRCDFEGRQIAGFVHDIDRGELQRPQHGSAWLASVAPGEVPIPVKLTFHTRFFGDATMYLTAAGREAGPPNR